MNVGATSFIERQMSSIPGWFSATDARIFTWVSQVQQEHGLVGDILEIGVYKGKSAVLLGHLLGEGEHLVLCDLFEQGPGLTGTASDGAEWYRGATLDGFLATYRRHHAQPPVVHQCPSRRLADREKGRAFRMMHIDGSHAYDDVRSDIDLVDTLLSGDGVVIVDDYRSLHTPGVSAAVWESVVNGRLRPLCLTQDKMYASRGPGTAGMRDRIRDRLQAASGVVAVDDRVLGHDVVIALPEDYGGGSRGSHVARALRQLLPPALAGLPERLRSLGAAWPKGDR